MKKLLDSKSLKSRTKRFSKCCCDSCVSSTFSFDCRFFELAPSAKKVFSFGNDDLVRSKRFVTHAKFFVGMIDKSLNLLGPDIELLTTILLDMGRQHHNFGVEASHYPPLGQAVLATLEELLKDKFTPKVRGAWVEVYQAMSYDMIRSVTLSE